MHYEPLDCAPQYTYCSVLWFMHRMPTGFSTFDKAPWWPQSMNGESLYGFVPKIKERTLCAHEHTHSHSYIVCYDISYCFVIRKLCDSVVTWLWARRSGVQFLGGARDFSLLHSIKTSSGTTPASCYSFGTLDMSLRGKEAGLWSSV